MVHSTLSLSLGRSRRKGPLKILSLEPRLVLPLLLPLLPPLLRLPITIIDEMLPRTPTLSIVGGCWRKILIMSPVMLCTSAWACHNSSLKTKSDAATLWITRTTIACQSQSSRQCYLGRRKGQQICPAVFIGRFPPSQRWVGPMIKESGFLRVFLSRRSFLVFWTHAGLSLDSRMSFLMDICTLEAVQP